MIADDSGRFRPIPELKFLKPHSRICFSIAGFVADILGRFLGLQLLVVLAPGGACNVALRLIQKDPKLGRILNAEVSKMLTIEI